MAYKIQHLRTGEDEDEIETLYMIIREDQDFEQILSGADTPKCMCDEEDDAMEILDLLNGKRGVMH